MSQLRSAYLEVVVASTNPISRWVESYRASSRDRFQEFTNLQETHHQPQLHMVMRRNHKSHYLLREIWACAAAGNELRTS